MNISIIVPIYNSESYIKACIESVVSQMTEGIELLLIDDGSTDQSPDICQMYCQTYDFISYVRKDNSGQGESRNLGIQLANGKYILFLDSDDELSQDALSSFLPFIDEDVDVVVSDMTKIYESHEILFKNYINFNQKPNINLMLSHPGPVAKLIKRELLIKHHVYFEVGKIFEDLLFNVKLGLFSSKVYYLPQSTYKYFIRKKSTMQSSKYEPKFDDIYAVMDSIYDTLIEHPLENEYLHIEHLLYSASLRALKYANTNSITNKNVMLLKERFPKYRKNPYLKLKSKKFQIVVMLLNFRLYSIIKWMLRKRGE